MNAKATLQLAGSGKSAQLKKFATIMFKNFVLTRLQQDHS